MSLPSFRQDSSGELSRNILFPGGVNPSGKIQLLEGGQMPEKVNWQVEFVSPTTYMTGLNMTVSSLGFSQIPDPTTSKLPPDTPHKRLMLLSEEAKEIIQTFDSRDYSNAIRKLSSLTESLRQIILSQTLQEASETLNLLVYSLESCRQAVFDALLQTQDVSEVIEDREIIDVLEGIKNTLEAFANRDEWCARMMEEWGGNRT